MQDRASKLFKLADLVEQHAEELALLEALVSTCLHRVYTQALCISVKICSDICEMQDTGKPFPAALYMDIAGFTSYVRHQAGYTTCTLIQSILN